VLDFDQNQKRHLHSFCEDCAHIADAFFAIIWENRIVIRSLAGLNSGVGSTITFFASPSGPATLRDFLGAGVDDERDFLATGFACFLDADLMGVLAGTLSKPLDGVFAGFLEGVFAGFLVGDLEGSFAGFLVGDFDDSFADFLGGDLDGLLAGTLDEALGASLGT